MLCSYIFLEGNELNILYCFSICYFNVTKFCLEKQAISRYLEKFHGVLGTKINIFCWRPAQKDKIAHVQLRYHTKCHGRLDRTVYGESSVKVSC